MPPPTLIAPRLLVATASQSLYQCIVKRLSGQGYAIQSALNSTQAAQVLLSEAPPDIALLDSYLPGRSLCDLAAEVKRRRADKQVWIIQLVPAQIHPSSIAIAADAGIDDLLLCPPGEGPSLTDLRIRLAVAARVLHHVQQLESRVKAVTLQSLHDSLTGLWNRESILRLLFAETDRVQRMGTPLSFVLLDIDHFSRVNAEHGYEAGDKVLHEMAIRLRRYMRSYDLLGRSGNDEFLIALPGCNAHQARHLAMRIRTIMLHTPFAAADGHLKITVSIGLAQSRGRSPLVVMREAEQSLAIARREGRDREHEYLPARAEESLLVNQPME